MLYCPGDAPFGDVWFKGAFNRCFFDTIEAVLLALIMCICGGIEIRMYWRHGTALDRGMLGAPPILYVAQVVLSVCVLLIHPIRLGFRFMDAVYGYMLLRDLVGMIVWTMSAVLIYVERNYDLPTPPLRGHSIYLVIFWALALAADTLYFANWNGKQWYFQLHSDVDVAMLVLFIVQWICECVIFILGMKAPGMVSNRQRNQYIYRPMDESPKVSCATAGPSPARFQYGSLSGASSAADLGGSRSDISLGTTLDQSIGVLREGLQSGRLVEQFRKLSRHSQGGSTAAAKERENERMNRYWNVLPYDHNRVLLEGAAGDYINASWVIMHVSGLEYRNQYIATQGPKQETIGHFWLMVWEQRVPVILMLTELTENNVRKCEQYWPELNESIQLEQLVVSCSHVERHAKLYTMREFYLIKLDTREEWNVVQFQLHGWPDHGAPKDTKKLEGFWRAVRQRMPERRMLQNDGESISPPIIVHCSAGVGRSGSYILMETLIFLIEAEAPLRPIELVKTLRDQRMAMVQTEEQLVFACRTALSYYDQTWKQRR